MYYNAQLVFFTLSLHLRSVVYNKQKKQCSSKFCLLDSLFPALNIKIGVAKTQQNSMYYNRKHLLSVAGIKADIGIKAPKNLRMRNLFTIRHIMTMKYRWRLRQTRETDTKRFRWIFVRTTTRKQFIRIHMIST